MLPSYGGLPPPQRIYELYGRDVNRLVRHLLGADVDQNGLVNEAFLAILANIDQFRDPERLHAWVRQVTANTVRTRLRRRVRRRRYYANPEAGDDVAVVRENREARQLVSRVYTKLDLSPADQRLAFCLRHFERQPLPQVAELCGCSLATIKRRLARAERRFQELARDDAGLRELLWGSRLLPDQAAEGSR